MKLNLRSLVYNQRLSAVFSDIIERLQQGIFVICPVNDLKLGKAISICTLYLPCANKLVPDHFFLFFGENVIHVIPEIIVRRTMNLRRVQLDRQLCPFDISGDTWPRYVNIVPENRGVSGGRRVFITLRTYVDDSDLYAKTIIEWARLLLI